MLVKRLSSSISWRASRWLARHTAQHWLPLATTAPVVSFSFDDAPASACTTGAALLEAQQARGTFYICGGLTNQHEQGRPCHSLPQLAALAHAGHEIACHTYQHLNCARASQQVIQADWEANEQFFKAHGLAPSSGGFAYPYGAYSWASKRAAQSQFSYARSTIGGAMHGRADRYLLSAQAMYDTIPLASLLALLEQTAAQRGWLIFYTHEIEPAPGPWGSSPARLVRLLTAAQSLGCHVLPVQAAIDYFDAGAP
ncbi:polysaccharide deacetylase family protein [Parvibium lacunae]|uniref:Chitin deacetylase n=1 Tax=Parvibium lacunae TaxID=1888893 RepID=A0A368KZ55_9BURK|nr:polysaccharide deacetylase family protein [Parvibium lacunae]RCS56668.1 chitin deacetylase [Parvibium lacunae]